MSHRRKVTAFFDKYYPNDLDCYGGMPPSIQNTFMYKGVIPGDKKIQTLQKYKFSICFENNFGPKYNGYITEKIFDCFAAGSVPVYLGGNNIGDYIPKNCFIDYRNFSSDQKLYDYLIGMSQEEHQQYIDNIKAFIKSDQAKIFTMEYFHQTLTNAIEQN